MRATAVIPGLLLATIPMVALEQERNAWNVVVSVLPRTCAITITALLTGATRISRNQSELLCRAIGTAGKWQR
jgi:hypothetical protein